MIRPQGARLWLIANCGLLMGAPGCSGQDSHPERNLMHGGTGAAGAAANSGGFSGAMGGAAGGADGGASGNAGHANGAVGGAPTGGTGAGGSNGGTDGGIAGCVSSGVFRTETMLAGSDCSTCHNFKVTGTVYPRADVPNACDGAPAVTIEVTGTDGEVVTLTSNRVGNFESDRPLSAPYTVLLRNSNGTKRPTHATNGNCNSCHTSDTSAGPGRIVAP